jgi:hypothetical protein
MSRYGPPGEPPGPGSRPEEYGPPADPWEAPPAESWRDLTTPPAGYPEPAYRPGPPSSDPGYGEHRYGEHQYADQRYGDQTYPLPSQPEYSYPEQGRGYGPPGGGQPPPEWDPAYVPPGGESRRRPIGLYALVTVLVVLAATGVGYALYLLSGDDSNQPGPVAPGGTPSAGASQPAGPEATRDNIGMNAAMALIDDCLVNDGSAGEPQMRIVPCDGAEGNGPVFQVLEIFNERVEGEGAAANQQAQGICADTEGYTHHYYEVGDTASFVLCMTELE